MAEITELVLPRGGPMPAGDGWHVAVVSRDRASSRLRIAIALPGVTESEVWVGLGETFMVGPRTWRFEDLVFRGSPDNYIVTLRYVPPGAPPFTPPPPTGDRVWASVELRHPGPVDEARIEQLEAELGRRLPVSYRDWLARNNGAVPTQIVTVRGSGINLNPSQPLMGIHPDSPYTDLRFGRQRGAEFFTDEYTVIAVASNGLIAVRLAEPEADCIVGLTNQNRDLSVAYAQRGYETPAQYVCNELLTFLAPNIFALEAYLQPLPPMPPATLGPPIPRLPGSAR